MITNGYTESDSRSTMFAEPRFEPMAWIARIYVLVYASNNDASLDWKNTQRVCTAAMGPQLGWVTFGNPEFGIVLLMSPFDSGRCYCKVCMQVNAGEGSPR
jgi:hypothetical protein